MFCFVLESCEHQAEKIIMLLRVSGLAESSTGYRKIPNFQFFLVYMQTSEVHTFIPPCNSN